MGGLTAVAHRVGDGAMLHLIKMWLQSPVEEPHEHGRKHRSPRNRDEGRRTPHSSGIGLQHLPVLSAHPFYFLGGSSAALGFSPRFLLNAESCKVLKIATMFGVN
jgi:hypothetical protein